MYESEDAVWAMVEDRLERARANAARRALLREQRPEPRLRRRLGHVLISAGQWLAGPPVPVRAVLAPAAAERRRG